VLAGRRRPKRSEELYRVIAYAYLHVGAAKHKKAAELVGLSVRMCSRTWHEGWFRQVGCGAHGGEQKIERVKPPLSEALDGLRESLSRNPPFEIRDLRPAPDEQEEAAEAVEDEDTHPAARRNVTVSLQKGAECQVVIDRLLLRQWRRFAADPALELTLDELLKLTRTAAISRHHLANATTGLKDPAPVLPQGAVASEATKLRDEAKDSLARSAAFGSGVPSDEKH
jgi:hypothetical protein